MAPPSVEQDTVAADEVRDVAETAFEELDAGELNFALAEPGTSRGETGTWHAGEFGATVRSDSIRSPFIRTLPPPDGSVPPAAGSARPPPPGFHQAGTVAPPPTATPPRSEAPTAAGGLLL